MPSCVNLLDPFGDFVFHVCPVITPRAIRVVGVKRWECFGDYLAFICRFNLLVAEEARLSMSNSFWVCPPPYKSTSSRQYFKLLLNEVSDIDPFSE